VTGLERTGRTPWPIQAAQEVDKSEKERNTTVYFKGTEVSFRLTSVPLAGYL
jgi:hypothetical protein